MTSNSVRNSNPESTPPIPLQPDLIVIPDQTSTMQNPLNSLSNSNALDRRNTCKRNPYDSVSLHWDLCIGIITRNALTLLPEPESAKVTHPLV
ncbi:hypothetical protein FQA39_LY15460 [Lamprigera yunnana]|nr:hypothetical protein FQA39_LY15460 [Lamprigera yunnana]